MKTSFYVQFEPVWGPYSDVVRGVKAVRMTQSRPGSLVAPLLVRFEADIDATVFTHPIVRLSIPSSDIEIVATTDVKEEA